MHEKTNATVQGIFALLFWSSTIAFSRSLAEQLGALTASSYIFLLAGAISCAYLMTSRRRLRAILRTPLKYLFGCGTLFIIYITCIYLAVGTATSRLQVLEVGLLNYLWPSLTLVLAVPVLARKAHYTLIPGCLLGFGGILLASVQSGESWEVFVGNFWANWFPYVLAFVAAMCWALYSNLTHRWAKEAETGAVPLFLLASGFVLAVLRLLVTERTEWTTQTGLELAYMAVFPTIIAYAFWDNAMRRGNMILVTSLSYLTPLLSIIISSVYLGVEAGAYLWVGCLLVIAGSLTCKMSVEETS
ncbi:MAG TPA: aromatic amino acid DMT transporter YddG [Candidatus Bathyarchaeia archaeon]|nr:aromatic amino acid DMT transporter YddG [Candidatus Bathyarchaeia archaeon]